jgi:transcriptional regulator with XRE-family HTH domain
VTDQHLADLLGLDLTDPETIAAAADAEALAVLIETLVRAREAASLTVAEVARRMETSVARVEDFERVGGDPHLTTVSRYARAVGCVLDLAIDGDDPMPPETAAGLADLRDRSDVFGAADDEPAEPNPRIQAAVAEMRAERTPMPERDGYTIGVYLPPGATEAVRDALFDRIADAVHSAEDGKPWDAHVVGMPGDRLGAVDGVVR